MGTRPKVFKKNYLDLDNDNVTITVTDDEATNTGQTFIDQIRNRNNISGWATTGSSDTATCQIVVDYVDELEVESIILVGHNFKDYQIQYWNGSSYVDFATPISITNSSAFVTEHAITKQAISRIRINIDSTQTADDDKRLRQLIMTRKIGDGQFSGWPEISKFERNQKRKSKQTLSGKYHVIQSSGSFEYRIRLKVWPYDTDLTLLEEIFFQNYDGFLFWPGGGDETQFKYSRVGYRAQDIVLLKPVSEFNPVFDKGIYKNGVNLDISFVEVI